MNKNQFSALAVVTLGIAALMPCAQAQTIVRLTGALAPENWTLASQFSEADFPVDDQKTQSGELPLHGPDHSVIEFCCYPPGIPDPEISELIIREPYNNDTLIGGPLTLKASFTVPFTGQLQFDYLADVQDGRGWGDGVSIYNSVGYTITGGTDVSLTPATGTDNATSPGYDDLLGSHYVVDVQAGDVFSFYLFTAGGSADSVSFSAKNFMLISSVPEPGEWMAMAGVGLLGFAGVRRWRQNKATANA